MARGRRGMARPVTRADIANQASWYLPGVILACSARLIAEKNANEARKRAAAVASFKRAAMSSCHQYGGVCETSRHSGEVLGVLAGDNEYGAGVIDARSVVAWRS